MSKSARLRSGAGAIAFLVLVGGCNSEPPPPQVYPVKGTVNLNGKPMAEGQIAFVNTEGPGREVVPVRNGTFNGEVSSGTRRIEIFAYREERQGVEMYGDQAPIAKINYVDPKFNTQSTLMESVNTQSANEYKFDVTSRR